MLVVLSGEGEEKIVRSVGPRRVRYGFDGGVGIDLVDGEETLAVGPREAR
jgi:hypothetical protein